MRHSFFEKMIPISALLSNSNLNCNFYKMAFYCLVSGIQPNKPKTNTSSTNNPIESDRKPETLDLADLDLSRLRLTKKDLETLSSITPDLPKHFQDQLLAQLPPNQARKLSRTLSMQNNSQTAPVKIYKRSLSGGREDVTIKADTKYPSTKVSSESVPPPYSKAIDRDTIPTEDSFIRNALFRRSFSGSKDSRSSSRCVNLDECNNYSPRSSHSSEISDKYKTYHSNSSENSSNLINRRRYEKDGSVYPSKYYDTLPPRRSITSPSKDYHARPPSGCLSPPPQSQQCESPVRRRPSQRRISRFLRPDFFDVPQEESCYVKDRKERDLETQNILKKIRERSRERSLDRREKSAEPFCDRSYYSNIDPITMKDRRKSSIPNLRATSVEPSAGIYHVRTKGENKCCDAVSDSMYLHRPRSISKPNENYNLPTRTQHSDNVPSNSSFADRILNELQNISIKQIMVCNDENCVEKKNRVKEITIRKADAKDIQMLAQQSGEVTDKSKKVSKLARPKSYPSKEQEIGKKVSPDKTDNVLEKIPESSNDKTVRPKSYPTARIASTKEIKSTKNLEVPKSAEEDNLSDVSRKTITPKGQTTIDQIAKKVKISKKNGKSDAIDQPNENEEIQVKVPEKKQKTGFLYSIGQKFEKLRENSKNKVLRKSNNKLGTDTNAISDNIESNGVDATSKSNSNNRSTETNTPDEKSSERKSRIDAMIRNLRERSVTRGPVMTESGLIKRAVSVEDLSDTFNKCSVNKVLGLFKKFENGGSNVQNTKSSSIIDSIVRIEKERPKSSEYMTKQKNGRKYSGAKSDTIVTFTDLVASPPISLDKMNGNMSKIPVKLSNCRDCSEEVDPTIVTKRHSSNGPKQTAEDKERMKQNRKGLVLDFNKIENGDVKHSLATCNNNNNNHCIKSINYNNNNNNNNGQATLHANGVLSPSYDSLTNYSSDSRSIHDDCASTSTFLSPTDEPELYFDDWSICSEDNNFTGTTPSPSLSRLSRNSQSSLMGDANNSSESVIDRIKRRSFYCRFNENKPKRQSNIVGPAAREYYREAAAKLKSRPPDRVSSPPVMEAHEYYRQLKQKQNNESKSSTPSSIKTKYDDLKANHRHSDYLLPKSNLNLNLPLPTSSSSRRISTTDNDYKYSHTNYLQNARSSAYEPSSLYGTYHSKIKPSSYTSNGTCLDSYATMGRKTRPYEHRSKSLMDSSIIASANNSTYKRDHRGTVEYGTLTR